MPFFVLHITETLYTGPRRCSKCPPHMGRLISAHVYSKEHLSKTIMYILFVIKIIASKYSSTGINICSFASFVCFFSSLPKKLWILLRFNQWKTKSLVKRNFFFFFCFFLIWFHVSKGQTSLSHIVHKEERDGGTPVWKIPSDCLKQPSSTLVWFLEWKKMAPCSINQWDSCYGGRMRQIRVPVNSSIIHFNTFCFFICSLDVSVR